MWRDTGNASLVQANRPQAQSMLWNNVTMVGTWIETQYSNITSSFETHSRIINNASLAMPHPGKYMREKGEGISLTIPPKAYIGLPPIEL